MKLSEQWLREWVNPPVDSERLCEQLTAAGMEVESVEAAAGDIDGVIVARIEAIEPHPQADKLRLCRVDSGDGELLQIVCGAPNVHAGMVAPLARVGARLPGGVKIRRSKIRGVASDGMLCSARELGLGEDHDGILALPADTPLGTDLVAALALADTVIDVSLTPNRGDCLSINGIARELAVINRMDVTEVAIEPVAAVIDDVLPVELVAADGCPRYVARIIRDVDASVSTPLWLRERLRRCGVRSISPAVDVTNFVMLELGQPMHAFDLDRLAGGIRVRRATSGERLALLDGSESTLDERALVIADHDKAVALAGIMGGADTAVEAGTRNLFLESAFFAPLEMAGEARRHGLHTESSHRFERGVSPDLQRRAIERATALLLDIVGGRPGPVIESVCEDLLPKTPRIRLRASRIEKLLGMPVAEDVVADCLTRLGMTLEHDGADWQVTPPPFRFDIAIEHDLIEEVARQVGYDQVPLRPPLAPLQMRERPEREVPRQRLHAALIERGYHEVVTFSFVDPKLQAMLEPDLQPLPLANPISSDLAVMRTTLLAGLLGTLVHNRKRQQSRVRVFEQALVFRPSGDDLEQATRIAGAITGPALPEQWAVAERALDFYDVKGDVEALLAAAGIDDARFESATHAALHPGQCAAVKHGDRHLGVLGALHPAVSRSLKLPAATFVFELDAAAISTRPVPVYQVVSKFPSVRRDLAVVVDEAVSAETLKETVGQCRIDMLQNLEFFDVYRGEGIDSGKKSLAVSLIFQAPSRTLSDDEVERFVGVIVDSLAKNLGASLRG